MRNHKGDDLKIDYVADEMQGSTIAAAADHCDERGGDDDTRWSRTDRLYEHQPKKRVGSSLVGKNVRTAYGLGIVLEYRVDDGMYVIKLTSETNFAAMAVVYSQQVPDVYKTKEDEMEELNAAYEALENMRRLNVQVMCSEAGITREVDYDMCTTCLLSHGFKDRSHFPRLQKLVDVAASTELLSFPRLQGLFHNSSSVTDNIETTTSTRIGDTQFQNTGEYVSSATRDETEDAVDNPITSNETDGSNIGTDNLGTSLPIVEDAPSSASACATTTQSPTMTQTSIVNSPEEDQEPTGNGGTPEQYVEHSPLIASGTPTSDNSPHNEAEGTASFPRLRGLWGSVQSIQNSVTSYASELSTQVDEAVGLDNSDTTPNSPDDGFTAASSPEEESPDVAPLEQNAATRVGIRSLFNNSSVKVSGLLGSVRTSATRVSHASPSILQPLDGSGRTSTPPSRTAGEKPIALPRIQKLIDKREKANTFACLICGSPCCTSHSSSSFRKEGITLCLSCERLFELQFIVDCVSEPDPTERAKHVDHMIACYDRCMLQLRYSSQFVETLAESLKEQKETQDLIGLAGSSAGVVSGVLGIAAAASILTPMGPSLLIGSLLFGGGATSVQAGSDVISFFSEQRKLADRIIALHSMALSILRVTSTLRDAMILENLRTDVYEAETVPLSSGVQGKLKTNRVTLLASTNISTGAIVASGAASEMNVVTKMAGARAAKGASAFSRASTAAARTVRFARFAGGALSAAVLVMEANAIKSTLRSINEGSPCQKADLLRMVAEEIEDFASTDELDQECRSYLTALSSRRQPHPETIATLDDMASQDLPEATCLIASESQYLENQQLCTPGLVVVEGDSTGTNEASSHQRGTQSEGAESTGSSTPFLTTLGISSFIGGSSLLSRIQFRQDLASSRYVEEVVAVPVVDDSNSPAAEELNLVV